MICLNDKKIYDKIKSLSFHGWNIDPWTRHKNSFYSKKKMKQHWNYEIVNLGYKYNMNDLMASIGISQFRKLKNLIYEEKNLRKVFKWYIKLKKFETNFSLYFKRLLLLVIFDKNKKKRSIS